MVLQGIFPTGIMPFGIIHNFLSGGQLMDTKPVNSADNYNTIISKVQCPKTHVIFVMSPKSSYEDVFENFF